MGGIFGGILGLVSGVGGIILTLAIGPTAAWRQTASGRWWRIIFGSFVTGAVLGCFVALIIAYAIEAYELVQPGYNHDEQVRVLAIFGAIASAVGFILAMMALEGIRKTIENS